MRTEAGPGNVGRKDDIGQLPERVVGWRWILVVRVERRTGDPPLRERL